MPTGAFLFGVAGFTFTVVATTMLQRIVPRHLLGRVTSASTSVQAATEVLSLPAAGAVLSASSIQSGAAALTLVAVIAGVAAAAMPPAGAE